MKIHCVWEDRGVSCLIFKVNVIHAKVGSTSCCYGPEVFCDLFDNNTALSKVSAAIGSTTSIPEDPGCVIFKCNKAVGDFSDEFTVSAGATPAEKPNGITAALFNKFYRIDESTTKRPLKPPLSSAGNI